MGSYHKVAENNCNFLASSTSVFVTGLTGWINVTPHTGSTMVLCKIVLRSTTLGEELFFNLSRLLLDSASAGEVHQSSHNYLFADKLASIHGIIIGTEVVAAVDPQFNSTIRHVKCEILISEEGRHQRCSIGSVCVY